MRLKVRDDLRPLLITAAAAAAGVCAMTLKNYEKAGLFRDVPLARQALRRLLTEPLRIAPATVDGRRTLRFEGVTTLGPLLDPTYKGVASPPQAELIPGHFAVLRVVRKLILLSGTRQRLKRAAA